MTKKALTKVSAFGKNSFQDYFDRFKYRFNHYQEKPLSWNEAEAFAMIAWHLYQDWLKHFFPKNFIQIRQDADKTIGREMSMIREIAEGLKHIKLYNVHKEIKDQHDHQGGFNNAFSHGFDISSLRLELTDGTFYEVELLAEEVYGYWAVYLKKNGLIYS